MEILVELFGVLKSFLGSLLVLNVSECFKPVSLVYLAEASGTDQKRLIKS